jgi:hypothetical protein
MNVYSLKFQARCPVDGATIDYEWTVYTEHVYMAEELRRIADGLGEGLHEKIADDLHDRFGGQQRLRATHAGAVLIETRRPAFMHWARPTPTREAE